MTLWKLPWRTFLSADRHTAWTIPEFLLELGTSEPEIMAELIQLYIKDTSVNLYLLEEQMLGNDVKAASATLHALKGSCLQIGGLKMGDIVIGAEEQLLSGDHEAACRSLKDLDSAFHELCLDMEEQLPGRTIAGKDTRL